MNDDEFIRRFEECTLAEDAFHHPDHVRLAWLYLRQGPVLEALGRFARGLRRFAREHGKANRYHETITWAYFFLIHERIARGVERQSWPEFTEANADLFEWKDGILSSYYRPGTLRSKLARRIFVLPERFRPEPGWPSERGEE